jgi:hypothetical protein
MSARPWPSGGGVIVGQTEGDWLVCAGRAFRSSHMVNRRVSAENWGLTPSICCVEVGKSARVVALDSEPH